MLSHQISQISIKCEYKIFYLKEKISRHAFFLPVFFFIPFVAFQDKFRIFSAILSSSFKYNLIESYFQNW